MTLASDHLATLCLSFPSYKVGKMSFYLTWLWWGPNTILCLQVYLEKQSSTEMKSGLNTLIVPRADPR